MEVVKFDKSYINEIVKKEISPEILDIVSEFVKTSKLEINERNVKVKLFLYINQVITVIRNY